MIFYDQDPDVVRWGLHNLIDVCSLSNAGSRSITQYDRDTSEVGYVAEGFNQTGTINHVENDAVIAHALQEELSRIASAQADGVHDPAQESVLGQYWLGPSGACHDSDNGNVQVVFSNSDHWSNKLNDDVCCQEEADNSGVLNNEEMLIPIAEEKSWFEELGHTLDITDESALDGEVGKRLNQMVPVPHVPRINGQMPSEDEEVSSHQRLLDRLKVYDLVENKVQGDGNCQFRALSDQLYRSPHHHKHVREQVVIQLKAQPQMYEGYVPMAFGEYLKKMSKTGEWGDHVTLQAAADSYGVKIFVITSFKDTCYIEILPRSQKSERVIFLSFWAEVHYNSIYPEGDILLENKRKKKWWMLGS
ncbi:hypothetical protein K2173_020369 [Erythroxylum novogranatense]|uniref:ubiquitinyl hydrolase 1 n=1 Tax=Erythroxylum novogranatense TaxID=1862640 RepID=A0AAV8TGJ4_9ROSI|nr:hypothetical protein K2173_020369 [Erythroxylum novogranatense]